MRRVAVRARAGTLAAVVVAGVVVGGCASPRDALGPTESACYQAIPTARAVAGSHATFAGVRKLGVGALQRALNAGSTALVSSVDLDAPPRRTSCVVAFRGAFSAARDVHALGPASGSYLIVVVELDSERVLAAVALKRPPIRISRLLPAGR